jgi:hypothetical protein
MSKISYTLTREDWLAVLLRESASYRLFTWQRAPVVFLIWLILGSCLVITFSESEHAFMAGFSAALLLPVGFWLLDRLWMAYIHYVAKAQSANTPGGDCSLEIGPECLIFSTKYSTSTVRWSAIREIRLIGSYACFCTDKTTGYLLPEHAFPDQTAFDEFVVLAMKYRDAPGIPAESSTAIQKKPS